MRFTQIARLGLGSVLVCGPPQAPLSMGGPGAARGEASGAANPAVDFPYYHPNTIWHEAITAGDVLAEACVAPGAALRFSEIKEGAAGPTRRRCVGSAGLHARSHR